MFGRCGSVLALTVGTAAAVGDRSTERTCRPPVVVLVNDDEGGEVDVEHLTLSSVVDGVRPEMLRTIRPTGVVAAAAALCSDDSAGGM